LIASNPAGDVVERMPVRREPEAHPVERGDEVEGLQVGPQRVGAVPDPGHVGRDGGQHVITGEQDTVLGVVEAEVVDGVARGVDRHELPSRELQALAVHDPAGRCRR